MRLQPLRSEDLFKKVKNLISPIKSGDGDLYLCSATLIDGSFLPCVVIQEADHRVKLAMKRFEETQKNKTLHESMGYKSIVKSFVCGGNQINYYDIGEIKISPYAFTEALLRQIKGETSMGWTEFTVKMKDGKEFLFGTSFHELFFDMPSGYIVQDIEAIIPSQMGKPKYDGKGQVYREKPFFTCYV